MDLVKFLKLINQPASPWEHRYESTCIEAVPTPYLVEMSRTRLPSRAFESFYCKAFANFGEVTVSNFVIHVLLSVQLQQSRRRCDIFLESCIQIGIADVSDLRAALHRIVVQDFDFVPWSSTQAIEVREKLPLLFATQPEGDCKDVTMLAPWAELQWSELNERRYGAITLIDPPSEFQSSSFIEFADRFLSQFGTVLLIGNTIRDQELFAAVASSWQRFSFRRTIGERIFLVLQRAQFEYQLDGFYE